MPDYSRSFIHILLTLIISVIPAAALSQPGSQTRTDVDRAILESVLDSEQNRRARMAPLIFDPVLIQTVELTETDENGSAQFSTIELSPLPSAGPAQQLQDDQEERSINRNFLDSSLEQFQQSILEFELEGGPYDYRLSELYMGIGNTYLQLDEHQLAIDAFNEALQLSRINNGLFTEDQLPIVEELVESHLSRGDISSANMNQEYLFYINQKIYGAAHPIILAELLEYADWNLHAASLNIGYIPNLQTMHFRSNSFNVASFDALIEAPKTEDLLTAAAFGYTQAIIMQHDLEASQRENPESAEFRDMIDSLNFGDAEYDIPATEKKLAYTYFLQHHFNQSYLSANPYGDSQGNYFLDSNVKGRTALERRYNYLEQNSNTPPIDLVQALLDIADWFLVFERWTSAEELYVQAFNLMESNGIETINGLAYPDLPAYIPSFVTSPYTRTSNNLSQEDVLEYQGYIDISFTLGRFAKPTGIRIIDSSEGTTEETIRALTRKLRNSTYRLQLENQTEYADNTYLIRYYYTNQLAEEI